MNAQWTEMQRAKVGQVYDLLARLIPVQGRDFTIQFDFDNPNGEMHVSMQPLTPFGKHWVEYCVAHMQHKMGAPDANAKRTKQDSPGMPAEEPVL